MQSLLSIKNLTKRFPGVTALEHISLELNSGEVHALMGENGAGKSTLIKILTGVYQADEGEIVFDGRPICPRNVVEAERAGITAIYQELNLIPYLSVSENIFLGHYPKRRGSIDWKRMNADAGALMLRLGVEMDVTRKLNSLGTASQQMVAIARAIHVKSRLLIMDEPTSSLDLSEVKVLFKVIEQLRREGVAVLFITHRLDEIYRVCDRVSVLKDGRYVGSYPIGEIDKLTLIERMIGRRREEAGAARRPDAGAGRLILSLSDIYQSPKLNGLSLEIHQGEILGLAGLLGSGRTETAKVIFGYEARSSGRMAFEGTPVKIRIPKHAVRLGIALCPEDRRVEGLIPNMPVADNITLASLRSIRRGPFVSRKKQLELVRGYIRELQIKTPGEAQLVKNLSGGNQQKVVLAKWLCTNPKLMILDEPTRGIDVGAKEEIMRIIHGLSRRGISILLISSELPELVANCTRIVVIREGKDLGELTGEDISEANILRMIAQEHDAGIA